MTQQQGITSRQFAYVILALLALAGFVGLLANELVRSHQREIEFAQRDAATKARLLESHAAEAIERIDVVLREVVEDYPRLAQLPAGAFNERLARHLALIPVSQSLRIVNAEGRFVFDASGVLPRATIPDRDYFQRHKNHPHSGLVISEPIFARITHNWVITVSRRLNAPDGSFAGVVQAAIRAEHFQNYYRTLDLGKQSVITLVDRQLRLIARYPEQTEALGKPLPSAELRRRIEAGETHGVYTAASSIDGVERIFAFETTPLLPFIVVVGRATEEVLAPWRQKAMYYALTTLVLAAGLATLIFVWQRSYHQALRLARQMSQAYHGTLAQNAALLDSLPDPAWMRDRNGITLAVNPAFLALCGKPREAVIGRTVFEIWETGDVALTFHQLDRGVIDSGERRRHEGALRDAMGREHYFEFVRSPVFGAEGEVVGVAGFARDVTERKEAEDRVRYLAAHDALTDLPNRLLLGEEMASAIAGSVGPRMRLALILIDLDHFKNVNDTLGHTLGDRLLQQVALRLRESLHQRDTVSRTGGDEFAVLLVDCANTAMIAVVVQRLLDALTQPFTVDGYEFNLTASAGISVYPEDGPDIGALLRNADAAMYSAKAAGRNRYRFFKPEMNQRIAERMQMEAALRRALERDELRLHYQPQFALRDGRPIGCEALLRWQPEGEAAIPPARFVPVAEDTGLIVPIGDWVLHEACRQNKAWQDAGLPPMVVAVNLSAVQFRQPGLARTVASALAVSGLDPRWLELEITESVVMEDADRVLRAMRELRRMGVRLSLDDFGTGYSSLSYLKRFPVDKIKIDQSFVREVHVNPDDAAIAGAVVAMAGKLGLAAIAEGIETPEQLAFLRQSGCDEGQGFLFARPVPAAALPEALAAGQERIRTA